MRGDGERTEPAVKALVERYRQVRSASEALAARLSAEDAQAQSMPDASPAKWHLAHSAWFFETFMLKPLLAGWREFDPAYGYLFNSYYEAVGERHPRAERGLITRPGLAQVLEWRAAVDEGMARLIPTLDGEGRALLALGLAHEEQHQELILMDVLHLFSRSAIKPAYYDDAPEPTPDPRPITFTNFDGGVAEIGHSGEGFAFDNEHPRHKVLVQPFALADRLVTNGEWLAFVEDGGYRRAEFWLADGWAMVQAQGWSAPLYWHGPAEFGLHGLHPLDRHAPVAHVSYYEADAFAAWAGQRLPTEAEWEQAVQSGAPACGQRWQWTRSAYLPHPGFKPGPGAVGEYNGKFMVGQMVLKGGSFASPEGHVRTSYRNFFYPQQRWMFSGVRLAADA
jgi:ergothioneine biosynthesis protein EgtB